MKERKASTWPRIGKCCLTAGQAFEQSCVSVGQREFPICQIVKTVDSNRGFFVIHLEECQSAGGDEREIGMDLREIAVFWQGFRFPVKEEDGKYKGEDERGEMVPICPAG